jgi:amino acid adenylation domain-containing protein/thioester reductase-like protein
MNSFKTSHDICLEQIEHSETIIEMFEIQVEKTLHSVAVLFEEQALTYQELNRKANQLAHYLQSLGVKPEVLVGIAIKRSLEMVIGLLGILKAGGAYLPLDPDYPIERLVFMLEDSQVPVLLTQFSLKDQLPSDQISVVYLDGDWGKISLFSEENPESGVKLNNLAYVIYTSGSTGQPKGVMIEQLSLINFIKVAIVEYEFTQRDRILQFASINFDAAIEEIFPCLASGGLLVLRSDDMLSSMSVFLQRCQDLELTVLDLPTAFWHQLTSELVTNNLMLPQSLRLVIIGGERALPASIELWQKLVGNSTLLVNTYGPTEATVVATMYPVPAAMQKWENIPIGRAIQNTQSYVLDKASQPVVEGVAGQLYIGGVCLARGYLNRPELTAEKFIPNPFSDKANARLYQTGDLVRSLPDGNLEFLGRIDHQVKIRGFRVELGEVEAALNEHPDVVESIVIPEEDQFGTLNLIAYIVSTFMPERIPYHSVCLAEVDGTTVTVQTEDISMGGISLTHIPTSLTLIKDQPIRLFFQLLSETEKRWVNGTVQWVGVTEAGIKFKVTETEQVVIKQSIEYSFQGFLKFFQRIITKSLRLYLKHKLPEYMLPSAVVLIRTFPLTPSGKINRHALEPEQVMKYQMPSLFGINNTLLEEELTDIWSDILGVKRIDRDDDFFELGGHSLLLTQLLSKTKAQLSITLPLEIFFESPTIAGMAEAIQKIRETGKTVVSSSKNIIDFNAEAVLDASIQPHEIIVDHYFVEPRAILLTGATGFLGVHILYDLLKQTSATIYCLVRSANDKEGKLKLESKLKSCFLWENSFKTRLTPVVGELAQPLLGLSESDFYYLANQIDVIYHCGAMVNFVYPYSQLKAINVLGTQYILKLATLIKTKPVHFISTLSVFASNGPRIVRESEIDEAETLDDTYSQSKWVAEQLVRQAGKRGLPVCIYRPSRIIGHSKTGFSNLNDLFSRGVKGCLQLGLLPPMEKIEDNMVSVDYVSRAIVYLSLQRESFGKTFHLVNPSYVLGVELVKWIRSLGYPLESRSYIEWRTALSRDKNNALYSLLSWFPEYNEENQNVIEPTFDFQNTIEGLKGSDIICPPINSEIFDKYFSYFLKSGFLNTM